MITMNTRHVVRKMAPHSSLVTPHLFSLSSSSSSLSSSSRTGIDFRSVINVVQLLFLTYICLIIAGDVFKEMKSDLEEEGKEVISEPHFFYVWRHYRKRNIKIPRVIMTVFTLTNVYNTKTMSGWNI